VERRNSATSRDGILSQSSLTRSVICYREKKQENSYSILKVVLRDKVSLRSKRFGKAFRAFDALFAFLAARKLGRAQKSASASISVALTPIFAQPKSEKRLQREESPTETLATQAMAR